MYTVYPRVKNIYSAFIFQLYGRLNHMNTCELLCHSAACTENQYFEQCPSEAVDKRGYHIEILGGQRGQNAKGTCLTI